MQGVHSCAAALPRVVDYKYAIWRDGCEADYEMQMTAYSVAVMKALGTDRAVSELWYLKRPMKILKKEYGLPEAEDRLKNLLSRYISAVETNVSARRRLSRNTQSSWSTSTADTTTTGPSLGRRVTTPRPRWRERVGLCGAIDQNASRFVLFERMRPAAAYRGGALLHPVHVPHLRTRSETAEDGSAVSLQGNVRFSLILFPKCLRLFGMTRYAACRTLGSSGCGARKAETMPPRLS